MAPPMSIAGVAALTKAEIRSVERTLMAGTWAITLGAMLFSVLTVTPLVLGVTPRGWEWTAPILPLVVDAAVIIVVRLDAVIARLGGTGGPWPLILRWMTGIMTLALNIGDAALHRNWVGVAVHSVAPLLLIVTAEASLAYRRAISAALARIAREQAEADEQDRQAREAAAEQSRNDRKAEAAAKAQAEHEARQHALLLQEQENDRVEARLASERAHSLALERERGNRDREAREAAREAERERAQRELDERVRQEQRDERRRREEASAAAARKLAVAAPAAVTQPRPVTARLPRQNRTVDAVVMSAEFAGMTQADAERSLFELYKQARDASTVADWKSDDPLFAPGGEFCGSNLGRRLGRSEAAGRSNVLPKFERWYSEYQQSQQETKELVGAG
ncbi:hypothetical protein [Streptomyces sp. NPDC097619]|uniref:hypothetical protein n=1 Tax=Streptomyces sp. NPDC097619 TaxID=3157228 RepID=UPI00332AB777